VPDVRAPSEIAVRSLVPAEEWCAAVEAARGRIRDGELVKVVLSREIEVTADVDFDAATLYNRLREVNPAALCFAVDGFVGASPELLVSRLGETVRAQPMAGTTRRTGHPEVDQRRAGELLASAKNRTEHQITIDAVHDALLGWCSYLDAEPVPSVVPAGPVQHLATLVEGHLSSPQPSVLELVAALHPTPAVGGHPTEPALELQRTLEQSPRGRYAGPVGWVDRSGNGAFAVGIRSVSLEGNRASLHAGVGVVADSDPAAELAETRAKAQALLSTLVRI
jgi:isochorismate synthase